jgi:hypothetical protein
MHVDQASGHSPGLPFCREQFVLTAQSSQSSACRAICNRLGRPWATRGGQPLYMHIPAWYCSPVPRSTCVTQYSLARHQHIDTQVDGNMNASEEGVSVIHPLAGHQLREVGIIGTEGHARHLVVCRQWTQ